MGGYVAMVRVRMTGYDGMMTVYAGDGCQRCGADDDDMSRRRIGWVGGCVNIAIWDGGWVMGGWVMGVGA